MKKVKRKRGEHIGITDDGLAGDEARRLRNALVALASLDPGWMWWIEKNIPKMMPFPQKRRRVERQARLLLTRNYQFTGCRLKLGIIYSDYYFTDEGNLKTYL
jgi:hypothetical protein